MAAELDVQLLDCLLPLGFCELLSSTAILAGVLSNGSYVREEVLREPLHLLPLWVVAGKLLRAGEPVRSLEALSTVNRVLALAAFTTLLSEAPYEIAAVGTPGWA